MRVSLRRLGSADARARTTAAAATAGLAGGLIARVAGQGDAADALWAATVVLLLVPLTASVIRSLLRRDVGVDAIALVSMAGALALREYLAGAVVALMLSGGNALEEVAGRRARRELTALLERVPRTALVRRADQLVEVPVDDVVVGDVVLVRAGEVVPVDGVVRSREAIVDESALTGEPMPVTVRAGRQIRSGTAAAGVPIELTALRPARESAYAGVVKLVERAQHDRAPFVRIADRYAAFFLPATALVAAVAWSVSGDAVRALAVFVVATPCPLILAAPIALLGGVSRAARRGVVVKGAGTIERLGRSRAVLFDKTGTLTLGHPVLDRLVAMDGSDADDALRLAAAADGASMHPFAKAVVAAAELRGVLPPPPDEVRETFGQGVEARVEGHAVLVGGRAWLTTHDVAVPADGRGNLLVAVDGKLVARGRVADKIRADARALVPGLRQAGIRHVALVTGDARAAADEVGEALGFDRVYWEQTPEEKLEVVKAVRALPGCSPVIMVGDGINDAPALALADVGIALGSAGSTVSSETADAVLLVDEIGRVTEAIHIGRRALMIARQSVLAGIGASLVAMGFAAAGMLAPVEGALLQEVIDVAVILNALRALRG